jgi:hypothetical protein
MIDFAWPQDAAEYRALGKYILVFGGVLGGW